MGARRSTQPQIDVAPAHRDVAHKRRRIHQAKLLPQTASSFPLQAILLFLIRWFWAVPFVVLAWRYLRRLPVESKAEPEPEWMGRSLFFRLEFLDKVSLAIIFGLWFLVWLGHRSIFPVPPDSYYHLLVARQVYETHSVPLWDWWEWAPLGRPQLYPPLYHILLALCAVPFHGDLLAAFRNLQPLMLPFAHLTTWYLARWLFGSRRAFVALLIVGMDPVLVTSSALGMPGVLVTSWVSIMIVFFLSGRWVFATVMLALAFYTHLGIPALTLLGLALFTALHRRYWSRYLAMTVMAALLAAPWFIRIYVFRDWFSHPLEQGLYGAIEPWKLPFVKLVWLQMVDVFIVVLVLVAIPRVRWRETRNQLLLCLLIGFLPMLVSYGGRYYIHTVHLWAIFAAVPFMGYLSGPVPWRKVGVLALLALCPAPSLIGRGTPFPSGMYPMPSAWMVPPAVALGGLRYLDGGGALGFVSLENCQEAADAIRARTRGGRIIDLTWDRDLGVAVGFLADRPIDVGAWEETMPDESSRLLIRWYAFHDPHACYLSRLRYGIPAGIRKERVGGMYLGIRNEGRKSIDAHDNAKKSSNKREKRRVNRRTRE